LDTTIHCCTLWCVLYLPSLSQNAMIIVVPTITILNNVCIYCIIVLFWKQTIDLSYEWTYDNTIICNHIIVVIEVIETANTFSTVRFSRV